MSGKKLTQRTYRLLLAACCLFCSLLHLSAQETIVIGQVLDESRNPLSGVSVFFKNTKAHIQTNDEGYFLIRYSGTENKLMFSCIGYKTQETRIKQGQSLGVEIILQEEITWLPEVFVLPGSNPAIDLIKKVRLAKHSNDLSKHPDYKATSKEETLVFLSKNNQRGINKRIWESLKSGNLLSSDSSMLIPLYMSEKLFQITSSNRSELSNNTFSSDKTADRILVQFASQLSGGINFYDNSFLLLGKSIISPLANIGNSYYKYYLTDSTSSENGKNYEVLFRSVNRKNLAFDGRLWIDSASFAITGIEANLPSQANINFINNFSVKQSFEASSKGLWTKQSEQLTMNLTYETFLDSMPTKAHLLVKQSSDFSPSISQIVPRENFADTEYLRETIDEKMKDLKRDPVFRSAMWIADAALTGYAKIGKLDLGKIQQILRVTDIEGWRWNIPLRTNEDLWKNICLGGYVGYVYKKEEVKYSGFAQFRLPTKKRYIFGIGYTDDYRRLDYNYNDFMIRENPLLTGDEDFSSSILRLSPSPRLNERKEFWASYSMDWNNNIESHLDFRSINQMPDSRYLPFVHNSEAINSLQSQSISLITRFSFNERRYEDHLQRIYISNSLPVFYLIGEYGKYSFSKQTGNYGKISAAMKQQFHFDIGNWKYILQFDQAFGTLPYPLLVFPHGSETPGYHLHRFTSMNYMEYAADRNIQFHNELTLNGIIFNNIPLIKHLNLRELCSFKLNYGMLNNSHNQLLDYPDYMKSAQSPYAEFGIGVANIFRVLSFQSIWSTSNLFTFENFRWSPILYLSIGF